MGTPKPIKTGTRFGRLVVIDKGEPVEFQRKDGSIHHAETSVVRCDCGAIKTILNNNLRRGHHNSCGCLRHEMRVAAKKTHGCTGTRLYTIWGNMIRRCNGRLTSPRNASYAKHGIKVCDEWRNSFKSFMSWALAHGYADNLSIDRINPIGDYEPSNCRWVTMCDQQNNKTSNVFLTAFGKHQTVSQWAREIGVQPKTIHARLKSGWTVEEALQQKAQR